VSSLQTPLTRRLGIEVPLGQAPIGSATCPELAAAGAEVWVTAGSAAAARAAAAAETDTVVETLAAEAREAVDGLPR
jgi:nitronate monooxygenase